MDKRALKDFAVYARNELRRQISLRAATFGVTSKGCVPMHVGLDYVEVNNKKYPMSYRKSFEKLFHEVEVKGFDNVIEEVAYTWFNRLIALRYMEVHDYLPSRIRVLSSEMPGKIDPDILTEYRHADFPEKVVFEVSTLLEQNDREGAYRKLLVAQCNELYTIMPFLFEEVTDYTELLLPDSLLHADSLINKLVFKLEEASFGEVEVLGWLYQYYMSERKEKVGGLKNNVVKKEDLPIVTQLFTPKWIVEYMVQNSLGKLYDEWKPENELASKWEYYLKASEPLPLPNVNKIEDIKFIDPACGSGHILVYAFDVLYDMYAEAGYRERDIPHLIFKNNLYGIDIDKRAMQIASFALMMKAQQKNRRFLRIAHELKFNILEFVDSGKISEEAISYLNNQIEDIGGVEEVISLFESAKQFGSLLVPQQTANYYQRCIKVIESFDLEAVDLVNEAYILELKEKLLPLLRQAYMLAAKYEVVVTNPPYHNKYNPLLKRFMDENYKYYKSDLYSAFIYRCSQMTNENGFAGLMTPFTWMFISSHEKLRRFIIENQSINSLVQPEYHACFDIANVPICTFVIQKQKNITEGYYIKIDERGADRQMIKVKEAVSKSNVSYLYQVKSLDFMKIPGYPIAYWASRQVRNIFKNSKSLSYFAEPRQGMATSDNNRFLRQWFEVNVNNIGFDIESSNQAILSKKKWFPYNKGGDFRKWYGNMEYIVNWEKDGYEIKNYVNDKGKLKSRPQNLSYMFKEGISFSYITSSTISMRYIPKGALFDVAGSSLFIEDEKNQPYIFELLGELTAKTTDHFLRILNPTINTQVGDIKRIPILFNHNEDINRIVKEAIKVSKYDWDSFEISWDFDHHPIIKYRYDAPTLEYSYTNWESHAETQFRQLQKNEEELNHIFINLHGLQDEITPEVPDKEITVRRANKERDVRSFLSYCVGLMMGRYSLDEEGLAYAGGEWDASKYKIFTPDEDGILPLTENVYFEDDVVSRLQKILVTIYGQDTLSENLRWLAESLTIKNNETPVERLRRYFFDEFYKDHCKIYSKRPIYWMIDSGKKKGFRALVYLHRYNTETLAKTRFQYVQNLQEKMRAEQRRLEQDLMNPDLTAAMKKRFSKQLITIKAQQEELVGFDKKLAELANQRIALDLDDGVVENYRKLQDVLATIK